MVSQLNSFSCPWECLQISNKQFMFRYSDWRRLNNGESRNLHIWRTKLQKMIHKNALTSLASFIALKTYFILVIASDCHSLIGPISVRTDHMDKTISYFKQDCYLAFDKEGNTQIVHEVLDLPLYRHAFIRINYEHPHQIPLFTDPTFSLQQLRMEIPFLCP